MAERPANTSPEEQAIRTAVEAWARARFDVRRIVHELAFADRRIDMLIVCQSDLVGVEVKGPRDRLGDDRVAHQLREFRFFLPEVWLVVDEKWRDHPLLRKFTGTNHAVFAGRRLTEQPARKRNAALRDEMCCSRLLELLWNEETYRVARREAVPVEYAPGRLLPVPRVKGALARLLTGQQIMKNVCTELLARPAHMVGRQSSAAVDLARG